MSADADIARAGPEGPVPAGQRIVALDVLRGIALLGIFIMNMPGFSHSLFTPPATDLGPIDRTVAALRDAFFAGKFNLLFGFLFGLGFTLQLRRLAATSLQAAAPPSSGTSRLLSGAAARPSDPLATVPSQALVLYTRRLAALLAIGLVHAVLLWSGDVLVIYAVLGFALLAVRRLSDRAVLVLLGLCLLYPAGSEILRALLFSFETETVAAFEYQDFELSNAIAYGHGSFLDAMRETARIFAWTYSSPFGLYSIAAFYVQMATGILAGFLVGRRGWIDRLPDRQADLRQWQRVALGLVLVGAVIELLTGGASTLVGLLARTIERAALAAFYALTVLRLVGEPGARGWLLPFADAGRMPLSNYLLQTVLGSLVFYGWGLGLWGRAGPLFETALAIALFFGVQLPLSRLWLRRFRHGPMESLWRRVTYA